MSKRAESVTARRAPKRRYKERRSNAERSATTRRKLIEAALQSLYTQGYVATTTDVVARRARVSRGAMLHHFRTRADLLVAVAQHVIDDQIRQRAEQLERIEAGPRRFFEAADISWDIQKQPATIALLEILSATRSDKDLQRKFAPLAEKMAQSRMWAARRMAEHLGVDDIDPIVDLLRIHLAALRGLAVELLFTRTPDEIERARRLLTHYEHTFARELMAKAKHG